MLDLIQLCVTFILELHPTFSAIFASSQRWGCYFNIGTFCGIVEQWCGLQWPLTGFIEIFEQNTVECGCNSLFWVIQVQIQNIKSLLYNTLYALINCHNITVIESAKQSVTSRLNSFTGSTIFSRFKYYWVKKTCSHKKAYYK